jgi:soluble lytic murein transglycosylase
MKRHLVVLLLLAATVLTLTLAERPRGTSAADPVVRDTVPAAALAALDQGRHLRASLLLRTYLATISDTAPSTILVAAQAEAGWGDWERVATLLARRPWLDSLNGGEGWNLIGQSSLALGEFARADSAFEKYLAVARGASDRTRGMAEARRARALIQLNDYDAAMAAYDRAAALLPQIADWMAYYAAAAAAEAGDTAAVAGLLARAGEDLRDDWGWRLPLRALRVAGDTVAAIEAAKAIGGGNGPASRRAEAWTAAGQMRLARGDTVRAREALRTSIEIAPGTSYAVEAARTLSDLPGLSASDRLEIGRLYLRHGNITRGADGVGAYLDAGAGSAAERTRLRYELGRAYFNAGRYKEAERLLLAVADQASPALAADALYLAGRAQYRDGRDEMGRGTFLDVVRRFPGQPEAVQAMFLSADLDHDDGNVERASDRYRRTIGMNADLDEVGLAYMRLGGMAFQDGDFTGAVEQYEAYRKRYPRGQRWAQSTYWSARSRQELGDDETARSLLREIRQRDPLSYYGGLAADLLGEPFWRLSLADSPPDEPGADETVVRALTRVDLLRELDRDDAAAYELDRARRRYGAGRIAYRFAEALAARGYGSAAISIGWEIYRRDGIWNERLLRIVYPFPYRDIVMAEAGERGVDPYLAAGLIRQESMFNARAVSPAGAIGLMQVMPQTGEILARQLDVGRFTSDLLKKPELNVTLGVRYLADQLDEYDGRLPVVLSAYNAGPSRVTRWREIFPEFPDDQLFAERIPFDETREYVKIVQQNGRMYRALYGDSGTGAGGR